MKYTSLLRYKGYSSTPMLFEDSVFDKMSLSPNLPEDNYHVENIEFKHQRLGKLVEEFVFYQLNQIPSVNWIVENLQVQKEKQTIGELDALYYFNNQPIHLEVVYKFYLYDTLNTYSNPLSYWIGPNRKDTLLYKLHKLKHKQFPLLYKTETRNLLKKKYQINIESVLQQAFFKAQLFLPYNTTKTTIAPLNSKCIAGFFISFKDMSIFEKLKFYIPKKLDWLVQPHNAVDWKNYESAKKIIEDHIKNKRSPLVWVKHHETKFEKCFITFW